MNIKRLLILATIMVLGLSQVSCKKPGEDDGKTLSTFTGSVKYTCPTYVKIGQVLTLTPSGVSRADGGENGYFWTVKPISDARDTTRLENDPDNIDGSLVYTVPDTICKLTITCSAFASGYYAISKTVNTVIVDPVKSFTGFSYPKTKFVDPRDNKEYPYTKVAGKDWFSKNLAYEAEGMPYEEEPVMGDLFGCYYNWEEANRVCPAGWRLPSSEDWDSLVAALPATQVAGAMMVDAFFNGEQLWEHWPNVAITNELGFCALPTGYASYNEDGGLFGGYKKYAAYWTSTQSDEDLAVYKYIFSEQPVLQSGAIDKVSFAAPVRCVRDSK